MAKRLTARITIIILVAVFFPRTISASQLVDFNVLVAEAFQHHRAASFYVRTGNPGVAAFELQRMQAKWQLVLKRFADSPPDAFAGDPMWGKSLRQVSGNLDAALAAANDGDLQASKQTLVQVQSEMAALRKRNSVWVFADRVDELDTVIDGLDTFVKQPPDLSSIQQANDIKNVAAVVAYLTARCRDEAPPQYQTNKEFRQLIEDMLKTTGNLVEAVDGKDERAVTGHIRTIRSHGRMLVLRFG
ncbi:MAG: hypothetical protein OES46_16755 [Gammaproteobacteria bacterium]|jgi:hypothetical protein|nr:hypothetical protein [Gammaproteobacteria bacterium]